MLTSSETTVSGVYLIELKIHNKIFFNTCKEVDLSVVMGSTKKGRCPTYGDPLGSTLCGRSSHYVRLPVVMPDS